MKNKVAKGSNLKRFAVFLQKGTRPIQEDYALVNNDRGFLMVADGFGGAIPGAEVSKLACESIQEFLDKEAGDADATFPFEIRKSFSLTGNVLFNSLIHANRKISEYNHKKDIHARGGASVVAAFCKGEHLALANVGTCSAWIFRKGEAKELVTPRSYGRMNDPFGSHEDESNIPLVSMGTLKDLEPEIFEYRLQKDDWVILHSDGLTPDLRQILLNLYLEQSTRGKFDTGEVLEMLNSFLFKDNAAVSLMIY